MTPGVSASVEAVKQSAFNALFAAHSSLRGQESHAFAATHPFSFPRSRDVTFLPFFASTRGISCAGDVTKDLTTACVKICRLQLVA